MAGSYKSDRELQSFLCGIQDSSQRCRRNIESIIAKYDRPYANDDLINLSTMSLTRNKGKLMRNPTHTMGKANLRSTKYKEEILLKQMQGRSHVNLDVSKAVARKCASILENSKQLTEDDVSDAETIESEYSDDDDADDDDDDNGGDDEVDGDIVEEPSDGEESDDEWSEDQVKNKRKDNDATSDEDGDEPLSQDSSLDKVAFSKDFQKDFIELTKHTQAGKGLRNCQDIDDVDEAGFMSLKSQRKPAMAKSSSKAALYSASHTNVSATPLNAKKKVISTEADKSITSSMVNLSFVENLKSSGRKPSAKCSTNANVTAATFNLSYTDKLKANMSNILSVQDLSFSAPTEDLSFVSISSPGKKPYYKPKKSLEMSRQETSGNTFVVDEPSWDMKQNSRYAKPSDPVNKDKQGLGGGSKRHTDLPVQTTTSKLEADTSSSDTAKQSLTSWKCDKLVSSSESVSSCPTPGAASPREGVFKSPQGIRVRRVRPKQLDSNVSLSSQENSLSGKSITPVFPKSPKRSKSSAEALVKLNSNSVTNSCTSLSSTENPLGLADHGVTNSDKVPLSDSSHGKENKTSGAVRAKSSEGGEFKNILKEVSFSSYDSGENRQPKSYDFALRSPSKRTGFRANGLPSREAFRNPEPGQDCPLKKPSPPKSDRLNLSLTSSLKNLDLETGCSSTRSNIFNQTANSKQLRTPPKQMYSRLPAHHEFQPLSAESCGLTKSSTTFTQLTSGLSHILPQKPQFPSASQASRVKSRTNRFKKCTFEPQSWSSKEMSQSKGQCTKSMKRKIPDSFTSGYFTETSPSVAELRQNFGSYSTKNVNTTFSLLDKAREKYKEKDDYQALRAQSPHRSSLCFQNPHSSFSKSSAIPQPSSAFVFGSKFNHRPASSFKDQQVDLSEQASAIRDSDRAVEDQTFSPTRESSEFCPLYRPRAGLPLQTKLDYSKSRNNPFLLTNQHNSPSPLPITPKVTSPQVFFNTDNSRVLRWVRATSQHYNPAGQTPRYPSCPPDLPVLPRSNCPTRGSQKIETKSYSSASEKQQTTSSSAPEKKDVGVQATFDFGLTRGMPGYMHMAEPPIWHPQKNQGFRFSTPQFSSWSTPSKFSSRSQNFATAHDPVPPQGTCSFGNKLSNLQLRSSNPSLKQADQEKSFSTYPGSLNARAIAVWREIQARKSESEDSCEDFSIIETESLQSPSTSVNDDGPSLDDDHEENNFANEEFVGETLIEPVPKQQSGLAVDLDKMFGGKLGGKSCVNFPKDKGRPGFGMKQSNSSSVTPSITSRQESQQDVMFPMWYIYKFSPDNPARVDSDATTYQYQQQLLASTPSFKAMLKSFKPRRHNQPRQANTNRPQHFNAASTPSKDPCFERPHKFRKVCEPSPPPTRMVKPTKCCGPGMCKTPSPASASKVRTDQLGPVSATTRFTTPTSVQTTNRRRSIPVPTGVSARASTPIRQIAYTPELDLEETVSTIVSPAAAIEVGEGSCSDSNTIIAQEDSLISVSSPGSDSDSDNEVSLL